MKILITGANGFVGNQLTTLLKKQGHQLLVALRQGHDANPCVVVGNLDTFDQWQEHLSDIDVVIHLAARVHQMLDKGEQVKTLYQRSNVDASLRLANAAINSQVKRFIFLSTIKVNGEETLTGQTFSSADKPAPEDDYAKSKNQAEQELTELCSNSSMELVIIRPPLVYGPGVKANFLRLVGLAQGGMPLPFSGLNNYRDMVSIDNLCDLIVHCLDHPRAAEKVWLVSDGVSYSTADIISTLRSVSGLPQRLFYCPPGLLKLLLTLAGKEALADRLLGNLQIDISDTITTLGWSPKYTLEHTVRKMLL